jgi:hypothetical protein
MQWPGRSKIFLSLCILIFVYWGQIVLLVIIILLICRVSGWIIIHYINTDVFIMHILATPLSREPGVDAAVAARFSHVSIGDAQTQLRNCVRKEASMVSSVIFLKQRRKLKCCAYTVCIISHGMYKTVVSTCCLVQL